MAPFGGVAKPYLSGLGASEASDGKVETVVGDYRAVPKGQGRNDPGFVASMKMMKMMNMMKIVKIWISFVPVRAVGWRESGVTLLWGRHVLVGTL